MRRYKKGKAKTGHGGKGGKVKSCKRAIGQEGQKSSPEEILSK